MRKTMRAIYATGDFLQKLLDVRLPMGVVAGLRTPAARNADSKHR